MIDNDIEILRFIHQAFIYFTNEPVKQNPSYSIPWVYTLYTRQPRDAGPSQPELMRRAPWNGPNSPDIITQARALAARKIYFFLLLNVVATAFHIPNSLEDRVVVYYLPLSRWVDDKSPANLFVNFEVKAARSRRYIYKCLCTHTHTHRRSNPRLAGTATTYMPTLIIYEKSRAIARKTIIGCFDLSRSEPSYIQMRSVYRGDFLLYNGRGILEFD